MNVPTFDPTRHHRRSIRLKGYDYTQAGAYYVTIVCKHREHFFGKVVNGEMQLNELGKLAQDCWLAIPEHHLHADLDEFIIMPNHVHGILVLDDGGVRKGVQLNAPTPRDPDNPFSVMSPHKRALGVVVRTYKAAVTTGCRGLNRYDFGWQINYHDHIVRDEQDLERIRAYIANNPLNWDADEENIS